MYDIEKIYEAYTIQEAIALKDKYPEARFIAGGSDLLVKIRDGKIKAGKLISLYLCDQLREIYLDENEDLIIGALGSFSQITEDDLVNKCCPSLAQAVDTAGGPQLRNIATIGGNVCNGVPSADSAPILFAYEAKLILENPQGQREVPIEEFYLGPGKVDLGPKDLLLGIKIKKPDYQGYSGYYYKYAMRNAMDIATSSCGILAKLDEDLKVVDIRAAYGVAGPIPMRVYKAEEFLKGKEASDENIKAFSKLALDELQPRDSWRASKDFRRQILYEIGKRSLYKIIEERKGGHNA
ncbi:MAG: xanthine dehydrogenase FAD-binding subunit XdhB [Bacillota bacterium]|nr:xanthine dehydrogenase FAD-binding subunit XdhB [Bacillota bacterium]